MVVAQSERLRWQPRCQLGRNNSTRSRAWKSSWRKSMLASGNGSAESPRHHGHGISTFTAAKCFTLDGYSTIPLLHALTMTTNPPAESAKSAIRPDIERLLQITRAENVRRRPGNPCSSASRQTVAPAASLIMLSLEADALGMDGRKRVTRPSVVLLVKDANAR